MTTAEVKVPQIYAALVKVMATVGAIAKEGRNQAQNFRFRGVDQVMNALHPALVEHGVIIIPIVLEKDFELRTNAKGTQMTFARLTMEYRFIAASDGSSVSAVVVGEAADSGDKTCSKCMAIAYKYACFQVLSIPTEETASDPDSTTHEPSTHLPKEATREVKATKKAVLDNIAARYRLSNPGVSLRAFLGKPGISSADITMEEIISYGNHLGTEVDNQDAL